MQQQQQDFDPVQRYKMLIPQLKESLQVMGDLALCHPGGWRRDCLVRERAREALRRKEE